MTPTPPRVLLNGPAADDIVGALEAAGYAVTRADRPTDLSAYSAVVVDADAKSTAAAAFTRLCRVEAGPRPLPIVWVVAEPCAAVAGLDAGADACLARPLDPAILAAQLRAATRLRDLLVDHEDRADSTRRVNDELRAAYAGAAAAVDLARRVRAGALPGKLPTVGPIRFGVAHHGPAAVGLYDVLRFDDDRAGFWLATAGGRRSIVGELVRLAILLAVPPRPTPPPEVLDNVNRALLRLDLDPSPLVGLAYGLINAHGGVVTLARAGLPPAVYLPPTGEPQSWVGPGPFLGAFDAEFASHGGELRPGDKLVFASSGEPAAVIEVAARHRSLAVPELAAAVARELECETALAVERFE
jgi:hypothetical protein